MGLTFIAIVLLVAAWAALLLPDFRNRRSSGPRRRDSIATFNQQLNLLDRARPGYRPSARIVAFPRRDGAPVMLAGRRPVRANVPRNSAQARMRRRRLLFGLVAAALVTLVAAVLISPLLFVVHLALDAALGGYVWLLVQHRVQLEQRRAGGRTRGSTDADVRPIRRTASGS
ncbi:MAG TPA: hypothetical protein VGQ20_04835 [Acidimicrobiales bacterium]|nr:hypothetical protein [Acidimicrobiales bacterium]